MADTHYLIFDTNIWIYLANSYNPRTGSYHDGVHFKFLNSLKKLVEEDKIKIITTELIKAEWVRNKANAYNLIDSYKKKIKANSDNLKHFKKYIDEVDKLTLDSIHEKFAENVERIIANNEEHIVQVENLLLGSTEVIDITSEAKDKAIALSINKLAPFLGKKSNSMADALILLSSVEYLKKIAVNESFFYEEESLTYRSAFFVTANKEDFSNPASAAEPHDDLKILFDSVKLNYRVDLAELMNELEVAVLRADEIAELSRLQDDYEDGMYYCTVCSPDDEHTLLNFILFGGQIELEPYVRHWQFDPNQLNIFDELEYQPSRTDNSGSDRVDVVYTETGHCAYCGTQHIKCVACQSAVALPDDRDTIDFECEGCGASYQVHQTYIGSGEHDVSISFSE